MPSHCQFLSVMILSCSGVAPSFWLFSYPFSSSVIQWPVGQVALLSVPFHICSYCPLCLEYLCRIPPVRQHCSFLLESAESVGVLFLPNGSSPKFKIYRWAHELSMRAPMSLWLLQMLTEHGFWGPNVFSTLLTSRWYIAFKPSSLS